MPSIAKINFTENSKDVQELWSIRQGLMGPGVAHRVNVMNRTAVIFITACWESYIEDAAFEAFEFMLTNATKASQIPEKVRALAMKDIWNQKDPTKVWEIADTGWKQVLTIHKADIKKSWLGNFNTPKTAQVNGLYKELLGLPKLSDSWYWPAMASARAENKLDKFIGIRGDIAHRLKHKSTVYQHWTKDYLGHVERIVDCCEAAVAKQVHAAVGIAPW